MNNENKTKKLVILSLLTAVSLILFVIETQLPPIIPIVPGVKIGIANIVTLFILYEGRFKTGDAFLVLIVRILLSSLITGRLLSLAFSFSGGVVALITMSVLRKIKALNLPIWVVSVAGAISHNITQILVSILIYGSSGFILYLPTLILSAIASGILTGATISYTLRTERKKRF